MSTENDDAKALYKIISKLEIEIYTSFWHDILTLVDGVNKKIQGVDTGLNECNVLLSTLKSTIEHLRTKFSDYLEKGKQLTKVENFTNRRMRQTNVRLENLGANREEAVQFNPSESFRIESFMPVCDKLITSLNDRSSAYETVYNLFGFLRQLQYLEHDQFREKCNNLVKFYKDDLEENLFIEILQFREIVKKYNIVNAPITKDEAQDDTLSYETKM